MQSANQNTANLLHAVRGLLAGSQAATSAVAELHSPLFDVFELLSPGETDLSRIIGWLLDPRATHGQRDKFLTLFLQHADLDGLDLGTDPRVRLEAPTERGRRIDILVVGPNAALAIENKPWARDQIDQMRDYHIHLDRHPSHCLVYLSGSADRGPSPASLPSDLRGERTSRDELKLMAYSDLLPWLSDCEAACRSAKVGSFLGDFQRYVARMFMGVEDMDKHNEIIELVGADQGLIEAAADVAAAWPDIQKGLMARFVEDLRSKAGPEWKVSGALAATKFSHLDLALSNEPGLSFRLVFDGRNYSDLCYGVVVDTPNVERSAIVLANLTRSSFGGGKQHDPNPTWCWWREASELDPDLPLPRNWQFATDGWTMIASGKLAGPVIDLASRLLAAAKAG
jgi:hypothetical protein